MSKYFEQKDASELPTKTDVYLTENGGVSFNAEEKCWQKYREPRLWWMMPIEQPIPSPKGLTLEEIQVKTDYYEFKIEVMNRIYETNQKEISELEQQLQTAKDSLELALKQAREDGVVDLEQIKTAIQQINK